MCKVVLTGMWPHVPNDKLNQGLHLNHSYVGQGRYRTMIVRVERMNNYLILRMPFIPPKGSIIPIRKSPLHCAMIEGLNVIYDQ